MRARRIIRADQHGSAVLLALGFMVIVLVLAAGVHSLVVGELRGSGALQRRVAAEYLADGAVAEAIAWFKAEGYQMPAEKTFTATVPVLLASDNKAVILPDHHPDAYTDTFGQTRTGIVTSFNKYLTKQSKTVGTYSVTAALIAQQPETWELVATGTSGDVERQVGVLMTRSQSALYTDALFGRDQVAMSGNAYTDSYDSSVGPYGAKNKFTTGDVQSNGPINLSGNAKVQGDATPGPNYKVGTSGNAGVSGTTDPATSPKTLPAVVIPANATDIGAINLSGNSSKTLTAGVYKVSNISISGNASLNIDSSGGGVTLYVTGSVSVAGNGISNSSGLPKNLSILQSGNGGLSFSGNSNYYGTIYAPDSQLAMSGNNEMFGSFIGSSMAISGNAAFHYDQILKTISGSSGQLQVISHWINP